MTNKIWTAHFNSLVWKKISVCFYWKGWLQLNTHKRGPTTVWHGNFWLLGFPSGPIRPSLNNLISQGSPWKAMLMSGLVRTLIQHESNVTRTPLLKPFQFTDLLVAGLQEFAIFPVIRSGMYSLYSKDATITLTVFFFLLNWSFLK